MLLKVKLLHGVSVKYYVELGSFSLYRSFITEMRLESIPLEDFMATSIIVST